MRNGKFKHSKVRNTGLLYEFLLRQITADVLEKGQKSKAISIVKEERTNQSIIKENKTYGPLITQQNELEEVSGRKIFNALNQNNKKVIISIKCETNSLDVRIPGRKWRGWIPAKEEFEKNLINDFC